MKQVTLLRAMLLFVVMAIGGVTLSAEKTAYVLKMGESFDGYAFDLLKFDAEVGLGSVETVKQCMWLPVSGTMADGKYYMQVEDDNDDSYWGYYDFDSESFKCLGSISFSEEMKDLAYDAAGGKIYGCKSKMIYSIDMATGKTTTAYTHASTTTFNGIAPDGNGGLWVFGYGMSDRFLYHIGADMQLAGEGVRLTLPEGYTALGTPVSLSFDNGALYGVIAMKTPASPNMYASVFAKVDTNTGAVTVIGSDLDGDKTVFGLSFGKDGGTTPDPDVPEAAVRVRSEFTYGDVMGESDALTKRTDYFYGPGDEVLRAIRYQVGADGSLEPYGYVRYTYTTDTDGNTVVRSAERKKVAGGGSISDTDRYWQDYNEAIGEMNVYAPDGKLLVKHLLGTDSTNYKYEGDNLVSAEAWYTTGGSKDGLCKSKVFYSDFAEGLKNCPKTVLNGSATATSVTIMEYEYDAKGNPIQCVTYKTTGVEKDDDGIFWKGAEKGAKKNLDTWSYDDKGRLVEHVFYYSYDAANDGWKASFSNKRQTYEYVGNVAKKLSYSGDGITLDGWSQAATYTATETAEYNGKASSLAGFKVEKVEGAAGTYFLSAEAPLTDGNVYNVYRDAEMIGQMAPNAESGMMEFTDKVGNGLHDWFVLTVNGTTEDPGSISDAVEVNVAVELVPVSVFRMATSKVNDEYIGPMYQVDVEWDAPETAGAKVLGYNFYANVAYIESASPVNEELITGTSFSYRWSEETFSEEHDSEDFYVEVVYDLGRAMSEKQTVKFEVEAPKVAANIAAFKKYETAANVTLLLNKAKITVHEVTDDAQTIIIEDASGAIMVDGTVYDELLGAFVKGGVELNGQLTGAVKREGRYTYVEANSRTANSVIQAVDAEVLPTEMTIAEAATAANEFRFVSITDAKMWFDDLMYTYSVKQDDNTIMLMDKFAKLPCDSKGEIIVYDALKYINGIIVPATGDADAYALMPYGEPVLESVASGIDSVGSDGKLGGDVYSVNGVMVRKAGESLDGLAKGVYVIGGKKVVVR